MKIKHTELNEFFARYGAVLEAAARRVHAMGARGEKYLSTEDVATFVSKELPDLYRKTVSGVRLIQLIDASMIAKGAPVRIVFLGDKKIGEEADGVKPKTMKLFDLFITDGEPLTDEDFSQIEGTAQ